MDNRHKIESHIDNICGKLPNLTVCYSRVETVSRKMC